MKTPILLLSLLALALCAGCSSRGKISNIQPVAIPSGLDARDAKAALVQSIIKTDFATADPASSNWEHIVDNLLSSRVWGYRSPFSDTRSARKSGWFIEAVNKDGVTYGYKRRAHYMRMSLKIDGTQIVPRVEHSENLDQSGDKIHPNAIAWVNNILSEVRFTLGQFSVMKAEATAAEKPSETASTPTP